MATKEARAAEYLSRYKSAQGEVQDIKRRIERIRDQMMGVKGIDYAGKDMPKTRDVERDLSDYVAKIDDLIRDWKMAQLRALELMREISDAITAVQHAQARRVLMLHFIDGYTYERIADMIPCDIRSVYRLRRVGLAQVVIKCQYKT